VPDGEREGRSAVSRPFKRGLISGLVYPGAWGSIADHRIALTTPDDEHGRAETLIPAPEKRKVGSSILPLITTTGQARCSARFSMRGFDGNRDGT
jgi:hypothetical protein